MNITTLVFIAVIAFFVWRGYEKGFIGSITRILSWLIAYPAAIFLTKPVANIIYNNTSLKGVIVYLIAGCSIFFVVSLLVSLLLNGIARLVPNNSFTETGSKIGGATVGILFGGVLGLLVVYMIDLVKKPSAQVEVAAAETVEDQEQRITNNEPAKARPVVVANEDTFIEGTAKTLVSNVASTAVNVALSDSTTAQITKTFARDPQTMLNHVQQLNNDGELKRLLDNPEVQSRLDAGDVQGLLQHEGFKELMNNPDMHAILQTGDDTNGTDANAERAAAEKMVSAWQKVETLKSDKRVQDIINDTTFQQQLNSPNKLPLMMNPKLRELTEIIFNSDSNASPLPKNTASPTLKMHTNYQVEDITDGRKAAPSQAPTKKKQEEPEQKIYRWTDENGKVHYSDKPIKE